MCAQWYMLLQILSKKLKLSLVQTDPNFSTCLQHYMFNTMFAIQYFLPQTLMLYYGLFEILPGAILFVWFAVFHVSYPLFELRDIRDNFGVMAWLCKSYMWCLQIDICCCKILSRKLKFARVKSVPILVFLYNITQYFLP